MFTSVVCVCVCIMNERAINYLLTDGIDVSPTDLVRPSNVYTVAKDNKLFNQTVYKHTI